MQGRGICPFSVSRDTIHLFEVKCSKANCELWDESESECSINVLVGLIKNKKS
jgi:hypothetical protein